MYIYNYNYYIEFHLNILIERMLPTNTLVERLLSRPDNLSGRILEVSKNFKVKILLHCLQIDCSIRSSQSFAN